MSKKLLTFLGNSDYKEVVYHLNGRRSRSTFIQEALIDLLDEELEVLICLTEKARSSNWLGQGREYMGLQERLDLRGVHYTALPIYDGKNEQEMWANFDRIYDALEEKDEIYLDVTHSFRSIPFIFMSVLNYAKFIKGIEIKGIYYGAFEASEDENKPVFDLTLFNTLTDWTVGAERLITSGDGTVFSHLVQNTVTPILRESKGKNEDARIARDLNKFLSEYSQSIYTSRGKKVSQAGFNFKNSLEKLQKVDIDKLKPFKKVISRILEKMDGYSGDIVRDIHHTVCLCRDFKLFQQGYTFLIENILNYVCIHAGLDLFERNHRDMAKDILLSESTSKNVELTEEEQDIKKKIGDKINSDLAIFYCDLADFRNDLNHAGYRQDSKAYKKFRDGLDKFILKAETLLRLDQ